MKRKVLAIVAALAAVGIGQTGTALADGNSAGDSVGVVQVGPVSASPSASATAANTSVSTTAPIAVTGSGNSAQQSVGVAQVGGGNSSTNSAGTAQVGGTMLPFGFTPAAQSSAQSTTAAAGAPTAAGTPTGPVGIAVQSRAPTQGVAGRVKTAGNPARVNVPEALRKVMTQATLPFTGLSLALWALFALAFGTLGTALRVRFG